MDPDSVLLPIQVLDAYMEDPTEDRAGDVLRAAGVALPYASLFRQTTGTKRPSKRMRGGNTMTWDTWCALDTLHDLDIPADSPGAALLLSHADLPLQDLAQKAPGSDRTRYIAEVLLGQAKPARIRRGRIEIDTELFERVSQWKYNRKTLHVMLDGALEALDSGDYEDRKRSAVLFAFFQLLLTTHNAVHVFDESLSLAKTYPHKQTLRSIVLVSGLFQTVDMPDFPKFVDRWLRSISKAVHIKGALQTDAIPSTALPGFMVESNTSLRVDGSSVPIGDSDHMTKTMKKTFRKRVHPGPRAALEYVMPRYALPHTKAHLQQLFAMYDALAPEERPPFDAFLWRVARINTFRDAYRAEVAIQMDAVFMTFDRLALHGYTRLGGSGEGIFLRPGLQGTDVLLA